MQRLFARKRALALLWCAWACLGCVDSAALWSRPDEMRVGLSRLAPTPAREPAAYRPTPLGLEVWATVHGTYVGPLHPDMVLHSGDRIGVRARTSSVADVYLLHCDGHSALSVYPAGGAVRFTADQRVDLPAVGMDLRLDASPGRETLYVVASRRPLEHADPALQALLQRANARGSAAAPPSTACGPELEALLASARWPIRPVESKRRRFALRGVDTSDAFDAVARAFADDDDVIVLRFAYQHAP